MSPPTGLIRLALFGSPVRHSLSPAIHTEFAARTGLSVEYKAIESDQPSFPDKLAEFARAGGLGCNITVPLKHIAYTLANEVDDDAQRAGAANTFLRRDDDSWFATNTDGAGLVIELEQLQGLTLASRRICIIGAGGAVAGILGPLLKTGPSEIVIVNRTLSRASMLAERHADSGTVRSEAADRIDRLAPFDLVINATSVGHHGDSPRLPASLFETDGLCYDLNYGHASQPLRQYCEHNDIGYRDGFGMLVAQAAESFRLWTGQQPDIAAVVASLRQSIT